MRCGEGGERAGFGSSERAARAVGHAVPLDSTERASLRRSTAMYVPVIPAADMSARRRTESESEQVAAWRDGGRSGQKSPDSGSGAAARADSVWERAGRRRSQAAKPERDEPAATTPGARFQIGKPRRASGIGHRQRGSAQRTLAGSKAMKTGRAQGKPGRSSKTAGWQRVAGDSGNGSAGGESSGGRQHRRGSDDVQVYGRGAETR